MSNTIVHIEKAKESIVPFLTDEEAKQYSQKGWTFSYIYSLRELRDVYLLVKKSGVKSLKDFSLLVESDIQYENSDWNERKVLEYLNALVNFKLLSSDYTISSKYFNSSNINSPLSEDDKSQLKEVFFSYFRFKEISNWFITMDKYTAKGYDEAGLIEKSKPIYFFSQDSRFTDSFLRDIKNINFVYRIPERMSHLMRFWDVYLNWGLKLGVIEKVNLSSADIRIEGRRGLSVTYFIKPFREFELLETIQEYFPEKRNVSIPELVYYIAVNYRYSINSIKDYLVEQIKKNKRLTYERASEIFIIKGKTKQKNIEQATYLYPQYKDYYLSHLIIRRANE